MPDVRSPRVVAIGDLNGAADALVEILEGTGCVDRSGRWCGGDTQLVQLGDIFNRGDEARKAFELLLGLKPEATAAGGCITILLGNHEVMTALGNEAYCSVGEYLSFATAAERAGWPARVRRTMLRLYSTYPKRGPIEPFHPRLEVWKYEHVPGKAAMRRALSANGRLGKVIRRLPVVHQIGTTVFVHAGLAPAWARLGLDGINGMTADAWRDAPEFFGDLPRRSILRAPSGPLLDRRFALNDGAETADLLDRSLQTLGARRMVVGHTLTRSCTGGSDGRILTRFDDRLVCADVGLRSGPAGARAALIIDGAEGFEWTPRETRRLWRDPAALTKPLRKVG